MKNAQILFNPLAGKYPSKLLTERAAAVLEQKGWHIELVETKEGQDITYLARMAAKNNIDVLFIAGGDGSVGNAAAGLVGTETALGVLPSGTANVWAREIGLPGLSLTKINALEEAAGILADGVIKDVDVGMCNKFPFLMWAGVGLDALIVHNMEPRSRLEKHFPVAQYATQALMTARTWRGMNLEIVVDGEEVNGRYVVAIVSNIRLYAGGLAELSPHACLDDGQMDLWLFAGDTIHETIRHIWNILSGQHVNSQDVINKSFEHLLIKSKSSLYLQHDGEPMESDHLVEISVLQRAMKVLVPRNLPKQLFGKN